MLKVDIRDNIENLSSFLKQNLIPFPCQFSHSRENRRASQIHCFSQILPHVIRFVVARFTSAEFTFPRLFLRRATQLAKWRQKTDF
jgi:hypothetical protein